MCSVVCLFRIRTAAASRYRDLLCQGKRYRGCQDYSFPSHLLQGSLRDVLDRGQLSGIAGYPLPALVLSLAHDVASALLHLHEGGIVHGDIKASNVLLTGAGAKDLQTGGTQWKSVTAKVADFGLALLLGPADTHATHNSRVGQPLYSVLNGRILKACSLCSLSCCMTKLWHSTRASVQKGQPEGQCTACVSGR